VNIPDWEGFFLTTARNHYHFKLAEEISSEFSSLPQVVGIALGGSSTKFTTDPNSDIDLYIFTHTEIPLDKRKAIAKNHNATPINLDLQYWDSGDEWFDGVTGIEVDIIYWDPVWIEDQINLRLVQHKASLGYSTCIWHTIKYATILYDDNSWLKDLKDFCNQPFPDELRRNIIKLNFPVLRNVIPAYYHQIEKAIQRNDLVSINHRVAALLASYFDIIFALNRITHPGEKRLLQLTKERCLLVPEKMDQQVKAFLELSASPRLDLLDQLNILINNLEILLVDEGINFHS
jgi:hypothetical protein